MLLLAVLLMPLTAAARFVSVDPKAGSYPNLSPYAYANDNPMKYVDPDGREVQRIVVNIRTARAKIYSDIKPVRDVPVAVTDFSRNSGPTAGTTLYVKGTHWGPVCQNVVGAETSWQQNEDNPFGPAIVTLEDANGVQSSDYLHGTNGPLDGGIDYLGGENPENRKFTHGCTRFTNQTIVEIKVEGVKVGAPVEFVDDPPPQDEDEDDDDTKDEANQAP